MGVFFMETCEMARLSLLGMRSVNSPSSAAFIIDTGANPIYVNDPQLLDPPVGPGPLPLLDSLTVSVADGRKTAVDSTGTFSGHPALHVAEFPNTLMPLSFLTSADKSAIFLDDSLHILPPAASPVLRALVDNHQPLFTSTSSTGIHEIPAETARTMLSVRKRHRKQPHHNLLPIYDTPFPKLFCYILQDSTIQLPRGGCPLSP